MTPFSVVEGPEAWKAAEYQDLSKSMYVFSDSDIAELDQAIAAVQEQGIDTKVGFYTPTMCNHSTSSLQLLCEMPGKLLLAQAGHVFLRCDLSGMSCSGESACSQNPVTPRA